MKARSLVLAALILTGCEPLADIETTDVAGTWVATQARYVEIAAPKRNNEDVLELGFDYTMTIDPAGDFVLLQQAPPEFDEDRLIPGTMEIDGTRLHVTTDTGEGDGEVFLQDDQVAFRITGGLTFNFGDGRDVPARLLLVMDRVDLLDQ